MKVATIKKNPKKLHSHIFLEFIVARLVVGKMTYYYYLSFRGFPFMFCMYNKAIFFSLQKGFKRNLDRYYAITANTAIYTLSLSRDV